MKKIINLILLIAGFIFADFDDQLRSIYIQKDIKSEFVSTDFVLSCGRGKKSLVNRRWLHDPLIKKVIKNFENFCKGEIQLIEDGESYIPKILHFVWIGPPMPSRVKVAIESWRYFHPDYEIKVWDNESLSDLEWIDDNFRNGFLEATSYSEKSDYIRMQALYNYGGVYVDSDFICLKSFDSILNRKISFFAGIEVPNKLENLNLVLNGALIASIPGSEIIRNCFSKFKKPSEAPGLGPNVRTGPYVVSQVLENYMKINQSDDVLILPCTYFYPTGTEWNLEKLSKKSTDFKKFINSISKEAMAVHLWAHSWK